MPTMTIRGWSVVPVVFSNEGEIATPFAVSPILVPAANWEAFKSGDDDEQVLAQVRAAIEGSAS